MFGLLSRGYWLQQETIVRYIMLIYFCNHFLKNRDCRVSMHNKKCFLMCCSWWNCLIVAAHGLYTSIRFQYVQHVLVSQSSTVFFSCFHCGFLVSPKHATEREASNGSVQLVTVTRRACWKWRAWSWSFLLGLCNWTSLRPGLESPCHGDNASEIKRSLAWLGD